MLDKRETLKNKIEKMELEEELAVVQAREQFGTRAKITRFDISHHGRGY
jgi:hypothetical protein